MKSAAENSFVTESVLSIVNRAQQFPGCHTKRTLRSAEARSNVLFHLKCARNNYSAFHTITIFLTLNKPSSRG